VQDAKNERKMDWIYRNIPGASVHRRTHQILEVPEIPYQEVFQTLVDLPVSEQEGGYQDRTPGKNERCGSQLLSGTCVVAVPADMHSYLAAGTSASWKRICATSPTTRAPCTTLGECNALLIAPMFTCSVVIAAL